LKNVLFVCTGNYDRSPTAEEMFSNLKELTVKSAGTSPTGMSPSSKQVTKEHLEWADVIFAMEECHREAMLKINASVEHKIIVLHVPNKYYKGQPELKKLLLKRLAPYFGLKNYS